MVLSEPRGPLFRRQLISEVKNRISPAPPLSMAIQAAGLRNSFPQGTTRLRRHSVGWLGEVYPGDYSRTYTVELLYKQGGHPTVWVRKPDLKPLIGQRRLPHVYDQETQELCLYLPDCGFWTPQKAIASTIMAWACLWLRNFELWIITNNWYTRGEHPKPSHSNN